MLDLRLKVLPSLSSKPIYSYIYLKNKNIVFCIVGDPAPSLALGMAPSKKGPTPAPDL